MSDDTILIDGLTVDRNFHRFVRDELLPATGGAEDRFWSGLAHIVDTLTVDNVALLAKRDKLQRSIDDFHASRPLCAVDPDEYEAFLRDIGYLAEPGPPFEIDTAGVDPEIATVAGPQLVVPVSNARFALNAANARWGSLYDALYGTDVISRSGNLAPAAGYNPVRGAAVIAYSARFLDRAVPLAEGSHADVTAYEVRRSGERTGLAAHFADGAAATLAEPEQLVGYTQVGERRSFLFCHHGLHLELQTDPGHPVGRNALANVSDLWLESAVTTIQDCEDSVAAVDADDKTRVYRNWLGLMQGTLEAGFDKHGKTILRRLNPDREYKAVDGGTLTLPGRSLMLVRNVGLLMRTDAVADRRSEPIFEGILDAVITVACAVNDVRGDTPLANSRTGSIYIVKPKMHGPDEAAFTDRLMGMVEDLFELPRHTIKIGVMDEERRTTVNLAECIRAVRHRLVFINTGFLDRTGDEIHTSMQAGPFLPKEAIKREPWIRAYEDRNVDTGLACGLPGKAQIGKGMFPKTDAMREMVDTKAAHPLAGASCAWVPSPTAATLHAMHYHEVDVAARQRELSAREPAALQDILTIPLGDPATLSATQVQTELDNNTQGILGYVVRWIDQGVGCSKVPDIDGVNLMEDRATLRISSQHIANWLLHGVCTGEQVRETLRRMAIVVDGQNAADPHYRPMSDDFDTSLAFRAASALVFEGASQPNGYTEPLLHDFRRKRKR